MLNTFTHEYFKPELISDLHLLSSFMFLIGFFNLSGCFNFLSFLINLEVMLLGVNFHIITSAVF